MGEEKVGSVSVCLSESEREVVCVVCVSAWLFAKERRRERVRKEERASVNERDRQERKGREAYLQFLARNDHPFLFFPLFVTTRLPSSSPPLLSRILPRLRGGGGR